ncbi:DsrE family protein [Aurantimonas sp. VKM B-3413]|uniref:DsrE family protein n=1 Tax=Aurantimonas sp. VKM B-3413 TaxID=2779401 RepID=UPI001E2B7903|nr:DsrE family protein [Aurantimonas sp. VKM B-3413]MCB8837196.1 DsrE family protein [Aurantimonas sp. VKM B-3413]
MRMFIGAVAALAVSSTQAVAGPTDSSSFDPVHYEAQKALYDFDFDNPADGERALGFIRNHIAAAKEFGNFENSKFVVVAHGNELNAFSRLNRSAFPDVYKHVKELADQGVEFHICRNAARSRGYQPDEFYDLFKVVPAAVIDIAKYENQGYSYIYPVVTHKMSRQDMVKAHPELEFEMDDPE